MFSLSTSLLVDDKAEAMTTIYSQLKLSVDLSQRKLSVELHSTGQLLKKINF